MTNSDPTTVKLCECGCGKPTSISQKNGRGNVKGQPRRFVSGHYTGRAILANKYPHKSGRHAHIALAEKALGRPLPKGACVHHADENPRNNDPSNLVICPDQKYHSLLHVRLRVFQAGGDPNTQRICCACKRLVLISQLTSAFKRQNTSECYECHNAYHMRRYRARREAAGFDVSKVRIRSVAPVEPQQPSLLEQEMR